MLDNSILSDNYRGALSVNLRGTAEVDYNCPLTDTSCKNNITSSTLISLGNFVVNYLPQPDYFAGIQFERLNYTRLNSFASTLAAYSYYNFILNFGEAVDTFPGRVRPANYDLKSWMDEVNTFMKNTTFQSSDGVQIIAGPGVSVNSKAWMNNASQFFDNCTVDTRCIFTFTMNFFENDTDCTIENMLSEHYLQTRLNDAFGSIRNDFHNWTRSYAISLLKLHYHNGIDTVTNTFAAALWAMDFFMEWLVMNGTFVYFDADTDSTNLQSPFTSSAGFTGTRPVDVRPMYYSMLLYSLLVDGSAQSIYKLKLSTNSNHNIKIYCLWSKPISKYVIINKDTSPVLSGNIQICTNGTLNASYYYL